MISNKNLAYIQYTTYQPKSRAVTKTKETTCLHGEQMVENGSQVGSRAPERGRGTWVTHAYEEKDFWGRKRTWVSYTYARGMQEKAEECKKEG
jgi:hypothetical protein